MGLGSLFEEFPYPTTLDPKSYQASRCEFWAFPVRRGFLQTLTLERFTLFVPVRVFCITQKHFYSYLCCGPDLLKGSWDLVTRIIIKVTILIFTYNPIMVLITLVIFYAESREPPSSP